MARQFASGIDLLGQLATSIGVNLSSGKLLGRSTAGTGAIEEITIGSGLSLSAGTLSATGGGANQADYGLVTESVNSTANYGSLV